MQLSARPSLEIKAGPATTDTSQVRQGSLRPRRGTSTVLPRLRRGATVAVGVYVIALLAGPRGPHIRRELGLQVAALGLVAAYTVLRAVTDRANRRWLVPLAGWMVFVAVGNAIANGPLEASRPPSARVLSTFVFICSYPCALATVLIVHRGRWRPAGVTPLLEAAVSAVSIAAVFVAFILPSTIAAAGTDPTTLLLVLAFPVFDLTVLGLAAAAVALSGVGPDRVSGWLGLGLAMFGSADWRFALGMARGDWATGHPIDAVWVLACAVVGLMSAAERATPREADRLGVASQTVPMVSAAAALAVLTVGTRTPLPVAGVILAVVALVGALLRLVLAHVELRALLASRRLAVTDELTGLGNRRALHEALDVVAREAADRPYSLLLLDLDKFKQVNDTLGHQAGDRLLAEVARSLRAVMPSDATVVRMGGDEFAVLVVDTPDDALTESALTFARGVSTTDLGPGLTVGASVGIARVVPGEQVSQGELLHRADTAMYQAKRTRSVVRVFAGTPDAEDPASAPAREVPQPRRDPARRG